jgi:pilus assembly protein Flp/PilA
LIDDRRGASLVEYIMLVGLVALVAAAGVRTFGQAVLARIEAQAACVATFDCAGHGPGDEGSSSGDTGPRPEPPTPTRDQVLAAVETANASGDLHALDSVDRFRQRLTPELQAEYDALLEQLRNDDRIELTYQPGVTANAGRDHGRR